MYRVGHVLFLRLADQKREGGGGGIKKKQAMKAIARKRNYYVSNFFSFSFSFSFSFQLLP